MIQRLQKSRDYQRRWRDKSLDNRGVSFFSPIRTTAVVDLARAN